MEVPVPPLNQVVQRVGSMFGFPTTESTRVLQAEIARRATYLVPIRQQHAILRAYYMNNGLYTLLQQALVETNLWTPGMAPLRNPTFRIVEFYASHLWPGPLDSALEIETDNEDIVEPIQQVWKWSNFAAKKQVLARDLALYGEMYVKVASDRPGQVYFQRIEPGDVTTLEIDNRGFATYVRIDIPTVDKSAPESRVIIHTEEWDKAKDRYRVWETDASSDTLPDLNSTPLAEMSLRGDMGIDFVPIAHAAFRDNGDDRGQSAVMPVLDKIDEANRQATRLAQIMYRYNRALWVALAGGLDKDGRPLPAIDVGVAAPVEVGDDTVISLPGASDLKSLVPNVNFDAYRNMLLDTMSEIQQDCPEMGYAQLFEKVSGDLSGRAIRFMLAPAIARAEEARGNGFSAFVRADQMAITLGQIMKVPPLSGVAGTFEDGSLDHSFKETDVLPASRTEDAEYEKAVADAVAAKVTAGWSLRQALEDTGMSEQEIEIMQQENATTGVIPVTGQ